MRYFRVLVLPLLITITGCASSSHFDKQAEMHDKVGDYYESIGQPGVAREEHNYAKESRDDAGNIVSIFVDLFYIFTDKWK